MALRIAKASVVPRTPGQMMWISVRKLPAPSIRAASSTDWSIWPMAAK